MTTRLGNAPVRRVALLATGERDAALLTMMVERMLVGKFRIGEAGSADVAIIDADAANGREALAKWRAMHPSAPCVLLGLKPPTDLARESGVAYVRKPISIPDLIHALLDLAGRIEANRPPRLDVAALRPSAPVPVVLRAEPLQPPKASAELAWDPEDTLSVAICMSVDQTEVLRSIGVGGASASALR